MNKTNFEHLFIAAIMQVCIAIFLIILGNMLGVAWLIDSAWLVGAAYSIGIFGGREHAQREYHIGNPSKLVGYEALDFWNWSLDAKLDLLFPIVAVIIIVSISLII